jgi:hypothetical protein
MSRERVSSTVDGDLLSAARHLEVWPNDSSLLDAALRALLSVHRRTEIDARYAAYDEHPLDEADEWGDLASFTDAARVSNSA